ncbi:MAG: hypothetical protein QME58_13665 [Bacteroidota bacterium]|nr:hypothetical protein [Bacteroidota bacterium]
MPDEKDKTQVRETTAVAIKTNELAAILAPKTGSLLPDGVALKILPSAKDFPMENMQTSKESVAKPLKITRSKADVNAGYVYLKRLEVLKDMLAGAADLATLRSRVKERREMVSQVFQQNMAAVFAKQRGLEKTYRELDTFFYESRLNPGEAVAYVSIVNAHADRDFNAIMDPETGLAARFPNRENFDMKSLIGMFVIPDWPGSEAKLAKYGELANHSMAHLFCGFPDMSIKEAQELFDVGGDLAELKSTDPIKQHISVVANPLRIRRANRFEKELGDFYINPAGILAGKIYKGDIKEGIHIAQANKPHEIKLPTPDGSPLEMKWNIRGGQQMKFNKALIPVAFYEGLVFWGVDTLYLASGLGDEGMDQYTVKRCDEYIAKVVLHYLNGRTFVPNEQSSRDQIQSAIQKFLMHNTGGPAKMLEFGKVEGVEVVTNPDGSVNNQAIDIRINVKYKNAIRQLNMYLVSTDSEHWKEGSK